MNRYSVKSSEYQSRYKGSNYYAGKTYTKKPDETDKTQPFKRFPGTRPEKKVYNEAACCGDPAQRKIFSRSWTRTQKPVVPNKAAENVAAAVKPKPFERPKWKQAASTVPDGFRCFDNSVCLPGLLYSDVVFGCTPVNLAKAAENMSLGPIAKDVQPKVEINAALFPNLSGFRTNASAWDKAQREGDSTLNQQQNTAAQAVADDGNAFAAPLVKYDECGAIAMDPNEKVINSQKLETLAEWAPSQELINLERDFRKLIFPSDEPRPLNPFEEPRARNPFDEPRLRNPFEEPRPMNPFEAQLPACVEPEPEPEPNANNNNDSKPVQTFTKYYEYFPEQHYFYHEHLARVREKFCLGDDPKFRF